VGISLEIGDKQNTENPRQLSLRTLENIQQADFLCLTGYDKPELNMQTMLEAIDLAQAHFLVSSSPRNFMPLVWLQQKSMQAIFTQVRMPSSFRPWYLSGEQ
jgi:hypothetical protein